VCLHQKGQSPAVAGPQFSASISAFGTLPLHILTKSNPAYLAALRTLGLQPDEKLFPISAKAFEVGIPTFESFEGIAFPKLTVRLVALPTFKEAHITALTDNRVAGRHLHKN